MRYRLAISLEQYAAIVSRQGRWRYVSAGHKGEMMQYSSEYIRDMVNLCEKEARFHRERLHTPHVADLWQQRADGWLAKLAVDPKRLVQYWERAHKA